VLRAGVVSATWECRVCGAVAFTSAADLPTPKKVKPPRSHWDMLRERRSIADLEQVLAERLALVRGGRGIDGNGQDSQRKSAEGWHRTFRHTTCRPRRMPRPL